MQKHTLHVCLALAALALSFLLPSPAQAASADLVVKNIDLSDLKSGGCPGTVAVEIENRGRAIGGGYGVNVEFSIGGNGTRTKTYKERLNGFPGETSQIIIFRDVVAQSTYQAAYSLTARVGVTGGNFREGNTRNNQLRIAEPIRARCPRGNTGSGTGASSGSNRGSNTGNGTGSSTGSSRPSTPSNNGSSRSTDLVVKNIDLSELKSGGCPGTVAVEIENRGRAIGGGYGVNVEFSIGGNGTRTKTYKERLNGFPGETSQIVIFRDVVAQSTYQASYSLTARVGVTGGNFREGNTRNNQLRIAQPIRARCPRSNSPVSNTGSNTGSTTGPGATRTPSASPDLVVKNIDFSRLQAGGCPGTVAVEIENRGREIGGGYGVTVEFILAGSGTRTKTYRERLNGFPGGTSQVIVFDDVVAQSTYQTAYSMTAKVNVTGGNFREGNTRNNQLRIAEPIRARCR